MNSTSGVVVNERKVCYVYVFVSIPYLSLSLSLCFRSS